MSWFKIEIDLRRRRRQKHGEKKEKATKVEKYALLDLDIVFYRKFNSCYGKEKQKDKQSEESVDLQMAFEEA